MLDELPEALTAHPLPAHVDKQGGLLRRFHQLRPDLSYVVAERPDRGVVQGDDSLPPLAFAVEHPGGQIQVVHIQGDELADPDSGGIEQLQHSPVPEALQVGTVRLLQKQFHFLAGEDLRQFALYLGGHHILGRIAVHDPQGNHAVIKGLDGGNRPGYGGGGLSLSGQAVHVELHILDRQFRQLQVLLRHGRLKLVHVPQIGTHRVGRRLFLRGQILLKQVQQFRHKHNSLSNAFNSQTTHYNTSLAAALKSTGAARYSNITQTIIAAAHSPSLPQ